MHKSRVGHSVKHHAIQHAHQPPVQPVTRTHTQAVGDGSKGEGPKHGQYHHCRSPAYGQGHDQGDRHLTESPHEGRQGLDIQSPHALQVATEAHHLFAGANVLSVNVRVDQGTVYPAVELLQARDHRSLQDPTRDYGAHDLGADEPDEEQEKLLDGRLVGGDEGEGTQQLAHDVRARHLKGGGGQEEDKGHKHRNPSWLQDRRHLDEENDSIQPRASVEVHGLRRIVIRHHFLLHRSTVNHRIRRYLNVHILW
mmetsp:Transcript_24543/g.40377  ORF Transcript_24543/g.40377 Transcript_24543/m.40377 type:complete len:253 (-) Transcript_24543:102-860(-)